MNPTMIFALMGAAEILVNQIVKLRQAASQSKELNLEQEKEIDLRFARMLASPHWKTDRELAAETSELRR